MNKRYLVEKSTVKDTLTGLMWHRHGSKNEMTWEDAHRYCKRLKTGKYNDWRLPSMEELITLIDFDLYNPASEFPGMKSSLYWSSTTYAGSTDYAWLVGFYGGYMGSGNKILNFYVRAVRG